MILGHAAYSANELANPRARSARRRRRGRAARRGADLAARAAAGLPQRRAAGDLQVAAGVDRAPLGALRLRHRRHPGRRCRAADDPRLPRPDHQRRGRQRSAGCRWCAGASPRSCCARACAPTATPAAGCWPRCAPCRATSCSRRRPATCCAWPSSSSTAPSTARVGVFARIHLNRDFVSVLVYFPADRFGPETRRKVTDVISHYWPGEVIGRDDRIVELDLARMQLLIAVRPGTQPRVAGAPGRRGRGREGDPALERRLRRPAGRRGRRGRTPSGCCASTATRCPRPTRRTSTPATAVRDIAPCSTSCRTEDGLGVRPLHARRTTTSADRRLKVFRTGQAVSLARALPIFTQMGIEVLDERPYEIELPGRRGRLDLRLRAAAARRHRLRRRPRPRNVIDARPAALARRRSSRTGSTRSSCGPTMTWWQANILRAYAKYLRQAGTTFSQGYIEQALVDNAADRARRSSSCSSRASTRPRARGAVLDDGQTSRVDAHRGDARRRRQPRPGPHPALAARAGQRDAAHQRLPHRTTDGNRRAAVAMKLDPRAIPDLPEPRPRFEIWVYSPRVEGVHLRFGAGRARRAALVGPARGLPHRGPRAGQGADGEERGHRPDRRQGRLRPQAAARPGRRPRRVAGRGRRLLPDVHLLPARRHRQLRHRRDGVQRVEPPPQTRRYDADDPYLVVAADKGTATFSDIANGIAIDYGFWLGDAFASGGSVGYDHKAMGITARGAWESVKYHFRELGVEHPGARTSPWSASATCPATCSATAMLLSEHIRLVAAFDHRHIFLDPDPDAATLVRRAAPAVRPAPLVLGRLRHVADLRGRRRVRAHAQVDPDQPAGRRRARHRRRRSRS